MKALPTSSQPSPTQVMHAPTKASLVPLHYILNANDSMIETESENSISDTYSSNNYEYRWRSKLDCARKS